MAPIPIHLSELMATITKPWSPVEVARFNDSVIRFARFEGEYHWHSHENEDEVFLVYRGEITIQMRGKPDLKLREGEVGVVPKGTEHCPRATSPAYVLMIEPASLESGGGRKKPKI